MTNTSHLFQTKRFMQLPGLSWLSNCSFNIKYDVLSSQFTTLFKLERELLKRPASFVKIWARFNFYLSLEVPSLDLSHFWLSLLGWLIRGIFLYLLIALFQAVHQMASSSWSSLTALSSVQKFAVFSVTVGG